MQYIFTLSTGELLAKTDQRLIDACETVAQWYETNAEAIRLEDHYASHVSKAKKDALMLEQFAWAEKVRNMENLHNFSVWQRVNQELTGQCVALLASYVARGCN